MSLIANGAGESAASNFYSGAVSSSIRMQNARLTETPGATGNDKKWTFSAWIKRGNLGASYIFAGTPHGGYNGIAAIYFTAENQLHTYYDTSGANPYGAVGPRLYRDNSSWYHLVWAVDAANTIHKIWINNELVSTDTGKYPPNYNYGINRSGSEMVIGDGSWDSYGSTDFNGYMAEINHCDGQYLEPDSFGETKNGVWIPLKDPSLTYGTNGFRLQFLQTGTSANSSGIGADTSGQANHFAVTALAASDVVPDSPENNFCTLNSIGRRYGQSYVGTFSEGNLKVATTGNATNVFGTMAINQIASQGGVYFEVRMDSLDTSRTYFGVVGDTGVNNQNAYANAGGYTFPIKGMLSNDPRGHFGTNTDGSSTDLRTGNTAFSDGEVIGIAILSDGKFFAHREGTYLKDASGNVGNPSTGANPLATIDLTLGDWFPYLGYNSSFSINFGQDGSFQGNETSGGNQDGNGIGDFMFAVPTNCFALCSSNMAEPTIGPNSGENNQADDHFKTVLYSGSSDDQTITTGLQPDWIWIKQRNGTGYHHLTDTSRGITRELHSNVTDAETNYGRIASSSSTGFTFEDDANTYTNESGNTYVAWNWKANGGTTTASGSESGNNPAYSVQANATAGFSIVTYTGTGSAGTVAHGLGAVPQMYIIKRRSNTGNWYVFHKDIGNTHRLRLDETSAKADEAAAFNDTSPTSSVFSIGTSVDVNADANTYVAYVFAEVDGYSKFGNYTANNTTDGTFIYLGFRPAWVMFKRTAGNAWGIKDSARSPINPLSNVLGADATTAEYTTGVALDFVSNGIKHRNDSGYFNNVAGDNFIYMAFAEAPFKYANAR